MRHATLWLAAALIACGGPIDRPTYIAVVPDADVVDAAPALVVGPWQPGQSRATVLELPGPTDDSARPGDLLLENDHLQAIVAGVDHHARGARSGGQLVATVARGGVDALGELAVTLDPTGRQLPVFTSVAVAQHGAGGGPAIVRATGHHPLDEKVEVTIDYVLEPQDHHVRIVVTVYNDTRGHYPDLTVGAYLLWGGLRPFVPGHGEAVAERQTRSDWVGGDGPEAGVVIAAKSGRLLATHGRDWSLVQLHAEHLRPGASAVGELHVHSEASGGVAAGVSRLYRARKTVVGRLHGRVVDGAGGPVAGARVTATTQRGEPLIRARTAADGTFAATIRAGQYTLVAEAAGRAASRPVRASLGAGETVGVELEMGRTGALAFAVDGPDGRPLAARLRLLGEGGTPTPRLGPPGGAPAAGNEVVAAEGRGRQAVPPGRYRVVVTAGPEFAVAERIVRVAPGGEASIRVSLARAMDRSGWYALDPHVLSKASPIASASVAARVAACAAEGLDGVVLLDDGRASVPVRGRVHVFSGLALAIPGVGRFAALPLPPKVLAPPYSPRRVDERLAELARMQGDPLVLVVRPRTAGWGYFEFFGFDPAAQTLPRGGFTLDFDLLEVAFPEEPAAVGHAVNDYFGLLDRDHPVVPVGGSSAASVAGQPCGQPRTWVRSGNLTDDAALVKALRGGDVVVSYGPLVDLTVDDARPGQTLPESAKRKATVRVQAPAWARPESLRLIVDGKVAAALRINGTGDLDMTKTFPLPGGARWVLAMVDGTTDVGAATGRSARPMAMTAAVRFGE